MAKSKLKKNSLIQQSDFFEKVIYEIVRILYTNPIKHSYSQMGEDIVIDRLLGHKRNGFYVDVGAYDPIRFSNTKRFYDKGWNGINIEPDRNQYLVFQRNRLRDTNLNLGIAENKGRIPFYIFEKATLSTFSKTDKLLNERKGYKFIGSKNVEVLPLSEIFKKYINNKKIDFISIDTEGYDMNVLRSNNWKIYRPKLICIENAEPGLRKIDNQKRNSEQQEYLTSKGYKIVFENDINSIYAESK